jgi:hypothetical protein
MANRTDTDAKSIHGTNPQVKAGCLLVAPVHLLADHCPAKAS